MAGEPDKDFSRSVIQKALNKAFAPEFLNRVDDIIMFDQLDKAAIHKIIDIELQGLYQRVSNLGYELSITDEAKRFHCDKRLRYPVRCPSVEACDPEVSGR